MAVFTIKFEFLQLRLELCAFGFVFDKQRCFSNNLTLHSDQGAPPQVRVLLLTGPLSTYKHEAAPLQPAFSSRSAASPEACTGDRGATPRRRCASQRKQGQTAGRREQTREAHGWAGSREYHFVRELIFTFFP